MADTSPSTRHIELAAPAAGIVRHRHLSAELVLAAVVGVSLLFFGLRETISAAILWPSNATLKQIDELQTVAPDALSRLISREETSLAIRDSAEGQGNLGLALALLAERNANDKAMLEKAQHALVRSLSSAPADPYVWTRLAIVRQHLGFDPRQIADDWRMAEMTGPNEDRLRIPRLGLAVSLWSELTESDRAVLFTDIRAAWNEDRDSVAKIASDAFTANVIRAALAVDVPQLLAFETRLKELKRVP